MSKHIKSIEEKKDEFRNYLEKFDVINALNQALISLYEEPVRPEFPIDYIKKKLAPQTDVDEENLKLVNKELEKTIEDLQEIIAKQNNELDRYKN